MMSKKNKSKEEMEKKLEEFNKNHKMSPTSSIMQPVKKEGFNKSLSDKEEQSIKERKKKSSNVTDILVNKDSVENTHTRRTFFIKNELLERLDEYAKQVKGTGFKSRFINYVIEQGLDQLDDMD